MESLGIVFFYLLFGGLIFVVFHYLIFNFKEDIKKEIIEDLEETLNEISYDHDSIIEHLIILENNLIEIIESMKK